MRRGGTCLAPVMLSPLARYCVCVSQVMHFGVIHESKALRRLRATGSKMQQYSVKSIEQEGPPLYSTYSKLAYSSRPVVRIDSRLRCTHHRTYSIQHEPRKYQWWYVIGQFDINANQNNGFTKVLPLLFFRMADCC